MRIKIYREFYHCIIYIANERRQKLYLSFFLSIGPPGPAGTSSPGGPGTSGQSGQPGKSRDYNHKNVPVYFNQIMCLKAKLLAKFFIRISKILNLMKIIPKSRLVLSLLCIFCIRVISLATGSMVPGLARATKRTNDLSIIFS